MVLKEKIAPKIKEFFRRKNILSVFSSAILGLAALTSTQGYVSNTELIQANLASTDACSGEIIVAIEKAPVGTSTIAQFTPEGGGFRKANLLEIYPWIQIGNILDKAVDPNGCRIVFSWQDKSGRSDLWRVGRNGKELERLTFSYEEEKNPTILEDGSIVFSEQRRVKNGPIINVLTTLDPETGERSDFGFDGLAVVVLPSGFIIESEQHDLIFHDLPTGFSTKIAEGSNLHRLPGNDYSITYTENDQIFMINGFFSSPVFIAFGEDFAPDPRRNEVAGIVAYNGQLFRYKNGQAVRMTHGPASYNHPVLAVAGGK